MLEFFLTPMRYETIVSGSVSSVQKQIFSTPAEVNHLEGCEPAARIATTISLKKPWVWKCRAAYTGAVYTSYSVNRFELLLLSQISKEIESTTFSSGRNINRSVASEVVDPIFAACDLQNKRALFTPLPASSTSVSHTLPRPATMIILVAAPTESNQYPMVLGHLL